MAATRDHSVRAHHIILYYLAHIALLASFYPARLLFRLWCWLQRVRPIALSRSSLSRRYYTIHSDAQPVARADRSLPVWCR